jgi:hypothetical protein
MTMTGHQNKRTVLPKSRHVQHAPPSSHRFPSTTSAPLLERAPLLMSAGIHGQGIPFATATRIATHLQGPELFQRSVNSRGVGLSFAIRNNQSDGTVDSQVYITRGIPPSGNAGWAPGEVKASRSTPRPP